MMLYMQVLGWMSKLDLDSDRSFCASSNWRESTRRLRATERALREGLVRVMGRMELNADMILWWRLCLE